MRGVGHMFGGDRPFDPARVAVYIRWSTDEQGQGTTLEVQREACEHFCRSQGWTFRPDLVYIDDGYSGGTLERPALTKLREAVRTGDVQCVVVYKLDRLSRSLLECVTLVRQEWSDRCALYSTKENFDTHSPVGQMVFNMLVSFAEFERSLIRDRTLSGKRKRAEQGRNAGQRYPYGYRKGVQGEWALDGWDGEQGCFTGRAAIVRRIFHEYLAGLGTTTIADRLRQEGIAAPMGGEWRFGAVARVLGNRCYAGQYVYGRGCKVDGSIPPIVTPGEFEAVQRLRQERQGRAPRSLASDYLFSGLARCGACGHPLNGSAGAAKRYYVCTKRVLLRGCDCAYIDAEKLERRFLAEVKRAVPYIVDCHAVAELEAEMRQRAEVQAHALRQAEEGLVAAVRKRRRLDDQFFAGHLDGRAYSRLLGTVEADVVQAEERLDRARDGLPAVALPDREQLVAVARQVDPWAELTPAELKQALREVTASLRVFQARSPYRGSRKENPNPLRIEWRPRLDLVL